MRDSLGPILKSLLIYSISVKAPLARDNEKEDQRNNIIILFF